MRIRPLPELRPANAQNTEPDGVVSDTLKAASSHLQ